MGAGGIRLYDTLSRRACHPSSLPLPRLTPCRKCRWRSWAPCGRRCRPTWRHPYGGSSICRPRWRRWSRATRATRRGKEYSPSCTTAQQRLHWLDVADSLFSSLCPSLQRANCCGVLDSKEGPVRTPGLCLFGGRLCACVCHWHRQAVVNFGHQSSGHKVIV